MSLTRSTYYLLIPIEFIDYLIEHLSRKYQIYYPFLILLLILPLSLNNFIISIFIPSKPKMDIFDSYPDDYKPEKYLTEEEMDKITNELKNHPLFMKELPKNPH